MLNYQHSFLFQIDSRNYGHRDDHLVEMVIKLYQIGVTTRQIEHERI